jgi:hypothetical protein
VKTHTIQLNTINSRSDARKNSPARKLNRILCLSANAFLALVPALAVVTGAAWLITAPDLVAYLQVSLWGAGFVFLGMAVDSAKPASLLYLLTGLALPALAMVSSRVAVEVAILAVAILATWTAVAIWRHTTVNTNSASA